MGYALISRQNNALSSDNTTLLYAHTASFSVQNAYAMYDENIIIPTPVH